VTEPAAGVDEDEQARAPELSVIVTTHNRRELMRACLESLGRQTASVDEYEVVVVVDGSTDGTDRMLAELAVPYRLSVVSEPQAGQSAARNAGAARAAGRVLLFIDDDEEAAPGLVAAHLKAHSGRAGIAGVGVIERRVPANADRLARLQVENAAAHINHLAAKPLTYLDAYGGNSSVLHSTFDEVGGYAADLPRETDFEFAYRLHEVGIEFVFLRDAVVSEYRVRSWRGILDDLEHRGRIAVELYRRHPPMISTMELGGHGGVSRGAAALRWLLLGLRTPPHALARVGFVLPRRWARPWFRFALNYSYWRGVRAAVDPELWQRSRRGTVILRYHAFGRDGERPSRYVVPQRRFERQLAWLARRGYNVISLSEYLDYRQEYRLPPAKSVVITIDDGYVDNDTVARPSLEQHGFSATIFLITASGARHPHATDPALIDRPLLTVDQAVRLAGGTIELGAHTRSHPDLTTIDAAAAEEEVVGSKRDLEQALGTSTDAFAYPNGAVDPDVRRIVERAGFLGAVGVKPGHNRPATDSFDLRRIEVRGTDSLLRFAATLLIGDTRSLFRG
jgi:peptidoglycan/xylan/chitin deacetylase (PgdA/CDA1 family)/GT2 family glycosyltransferase